MNEILWLDDDNLPYTVCGAGDLFWFKNWDSGCYIRTSIPVACRGNFRVYLHYLQERRSAYSELWAELDSSDDYNID